MKSKLLSVRATDALLARLDRIARETGDTRSAVVRVLLAASAHRASGPEPAKESAEDEAC